MNNKPSFILDAPSGPERIAKHIARAGVCSRREAEARISDGRVTVNGETIFSPALNVSAADSITVDGKPLPPREPARLWRYNKPRGLIVSDRDEKGRETIFDRLPDSLPRVLSVGRLDLDSEGLLLLTNDGGLARHLELPSTGWSRKYRVRVQGQVDAAALEPLSEGITVDGIRYGRVTARLDRQMASNAWLTVAIREGRNREVRRIMEHLGHQVSRLIRVSYGPFQLGELPSGSVDAVKPRILADQLGLTESSGQETSDAGGRAGGQRRKTLSRTHSSRTSQSQGQRHANHRRPTARHKAGPARRR
ncbi:MAG: pseudouridine synthase [Pseudomonadota bacterium]|nr:pseudouridine synthase [Pseudomonadota bacterium]